MTRATDVANEVDARLRARTDVERREFTKGYFPSAMENLGVAVPHQKAIVRDLKKRLKHADAATVLGIVRAILRKHTLEGRQVAYFVLNEHAAAMASLDKSQVEELGRGIDNWTSVDTFGCYVAGPAWREGRIKDATVKAWTKSKDRWQRRAALVSTVALNLPSRGGAGDTRRTLGICERLVGDHDDMVVKGMSWALRSLGTVDPAAVRTFLGEHEPILHARAMREVRNKLVTGLKVPKQTRKKA
jgi:3-methyladenine DNA glycosylase AlkD